MRQTIIATLLATAAFSVLALMRGAAYLETPLPGGLPIGNGLAALGLCAGAGAAVAITVRGTALRIVALVSLFACVVWLPVSVALAGNLSLNFGGGRGVIWLVVSIAVVAVAGCTLVSALVAAVRRGRRPTQPG